jgi:uncharacterized protein YbjQ (UPF0145 family)
MPFWRKDTEEERQRKELAAQKKADQEESIRQLEAGGLPVQATKRLTAQMASGSKPFSSSLTAKEYLLAREAGYQPIGQVMGTSFMRVGSSYYNQGYGWYQTGEVTSLTQTHKVARELAADRLKQEAKLLGADGVIGVRIKKTDHTWSKGVSEFTAIGTAIRLPDREMLAHIKNLPFTSSLSGQEFWQLYEGGYLPCGLVMGNCSYYVYGTSQTWSAQFGFFSSMVNQELTDFNNGFTCARRLAVDRLKQATAEEGADGAVAMDVEYTLQRARLDTGNQHNINLMVDFMALGTGVIKRPDGKARILHQPLFIMDLAGRNERECHIEQKNEAVAMSNKTIPDH